MTRRCSLWKRAAAQSVWSNALGNGTRRVLTRQMLDPLSMRKVPGSFYRLTCKTMEPTLSWILEQYRGKSIFVNV